MNGKKLIEELFVMTPKRTETIKNVLKLFKAIDWSEHEKYGIEIYSKWSENSVVFIIWKTSKISDEYYEGIKSILSSLNMKEEDNCNPIYTFLSTLSSDDVLKKRLSSENGISFIKAKACDNLADYVNFVITRKALSEL